MECCYHFGFYFIFFFCQTVHDRKLFPFSLSNACFLIKLFFILVFVASVYFCLQNEIQLLLIPYHAIKVYLITIISQQQSTRNGYITFSLRKQTAFSLFISDNLNFFIYNWWFHHKSAKLEQNTSSSGTIWDLLFRNPVSRMLWKPKYKRITKKIICFISKT